MAGRNERGISVVPALLALSIVLFVCMVGAHFFKPDDADDSDVAAGGATAAHSDLLDAESYRMSIEALESHLYHESPGDFSTNNDVAALAHELAMEVRGDGTDRKQHEAFGRIFDWAGRVDAQAEAGYTVADRAKLRRQWESVRDGVFAPADWFGSSSAELASAQARPTATVDPEWMRRMEIAADRLDTLIRRGRRRALAIPEASVDAGLRTSGARDATQRWNDFVRSWSESVDDMGQALPDHPGWDSGTDMVMAHQEMGQALNELRNVGFSAASTSNIPFMYERESRFDQAEYRLEKAREHLAKLEESY